MTREQARKWFQSHKTSDTMVNEAYDIAIEALSADRPTEAFGTMCGQSNQAIEYALEHIKAGEEYCYDCEAVEVCKWHPYDGCQFKVSRPTGEWIHDGVDVEGGVDWMHCSNCGKSDVWADATRTNFCPNCGARMKGGAE